MQAPVFFKKGKPLDQLPDWQLAMIGIGSAPVTLFLAFMVADVLPDFLEKVAGSGVNAHAAGIFVLFGVVLACIYHFGRMVIGCGKVLWARHFK